MLESAIKEHEKMKHRIPLLYSKNTVTKKADQCTGVEQCGTLLHMCMVLVHWPEHALVFGTTKAEFTATDRWDWRRCYRK